MLVEIRTQSFNAWHELQAYRERLDADGQYGATAAFVGTMRDFNEGKQVAHMTLEHYPGMTEKHLDTIAGEAVETWNLLDVLIVHRVGRIDIGEDIVLVATWSAHRKQAFESCRSIMEKLKSTAPFWKKEATPSGPRWVEKNSSGY